MQNNTVEAKKEYTIEELEQMLERSWSMENKAGHGKEDISCSYAGTIARGIRLYDIYLGDDNSTWFLNRFMTKKGPVSEYEYIFGRKEKKRKGTK